MVDVTLIRPLNKSQGHSFWYQSISHIPGTISYRLSVVTFALVRTVWPPYITLQMASWQTTTDVTLYHAPAPAILIIISLIFTVKIRTEEFDENFEIFLRR